MTGQYIVEVAHAWLPAVGFGAVLTAGASSSAAAPTTVVAVAGAGADTTT